MSTLFCPAPLRQFRSPKTGNLYGRPFTTARHAGRLVASRSLAASLIKVTVNNFTKSDVRQECVFDCWLLLGRRKQAGFEAWVSITLNQGMEGAGEAAAPAGFRRVCCALRPNHGLHGSQAVMYWEMGWLARREEEEGEPEEAETLPESKKGKRRVAAVVEGQGCCACKFERGGCFPCGRRKALRSCKAILLALFCLRSSQFLVVSFWMAGAH